MTRPVALRQKDEPDEHCNGDDDDTGPCAATIVLVVGSGSVSRHFQEPGGSLACCCAVS